MKIKNYTVLYLEGFNRHKTFILEAAIEEQNVNSLFNNSIDLKNLIDASTEDQLRYIFYKIKNDLPSGSVTSTINKCIEATQNNNYRNASNEILNLFQSNYTVTFDQNDTRNIVKLYKAFQTPADLSRPAPPPLQNFGIPYTGSTSISSVSADTSTQSTAASSLSADSNPASTGGLTAGSPLAGQATPSDLNARGEQLRQNSTYRRDARSIGNATRPISPQGGPTYYARISAGRYRPAVQADMSANVPLYIKNPNPLSALAKPYVQVADEVLRARRASPSDAQSFDKEMRARGLQRLAPSGQTRKEADGSVRRKSQFGGALGSLSNLMGDVGNTIKKGN